LRPSQRRAWLARHYTIAEYAIIQLFNRIRPIEVTVRMRSRLFLGALGLLLMVAACAALALASPTTESRWRAHADAMRRWEKRDFTRYRMVIEEDGCTADYEVRAEHVAWGHELPCGRGQPRAVSNLFLLIDTGTSEPECVGNRCACQRHTTIDAHYDPQLGYPQRIVVRAQIWPNWRDAAFWSQLFEQRRNPCAGGSERALTVKELIPRQ
jgi:hypothetical protein